MYRSVAVFFCIVVVTAVSASLFASPTTTQSATSSTTPNSENAGSYVTYQAGSATWLNAPRVVQMSQSVIFQQDDEVLETDSAVVNLDTKQRATFARSGGPVHIYDKQDDLRGNEGFIDFTRHLASLRGGITLVVKPGIREETAPSTSIRREFKEAATLTCDAMVYDYRNKIGNAPNEITVRQTVVEGSKSILRKLTADSGAYNARSSVLTLTGHVHGYNGEDQIQSETAIVGLKEGNEYINLPTHLHGVFGVPPAEKDDLSAGPSSAAPTPPSPSH